MEISSNESDDSEEETSFSLNPPQAITNIFSNNVAEEYAKLIIKHNLNQKAANDICKFFNKFSLWSKSPLPSSAKETRQIIDQIKTKNIEFKKKLVTSLNGIDYFLEYRTILSAIAELLENELIASVCKFDYQEKIAFEVSYLIFNMLNC
jgi:hypothetical protein